MEKSGLSVYVATRLSVNVCVSMCVCTHARVCTCMRQKVPGLLCAVPAGRVAVRMALFPVSALK